MQPSPTKYLLVVLLCCAAAPVHGNEADKKNGPVVYLGRRLTPEQIVSFTTTVQAAEPDAVVLLDHPRAGAQMERVIEQFSAQGVKPLSWDRNPPAELWKRLFPRAGEVVICQTSNRHLLLQAACLAANLRAPLYLFDPEEGAPAELSHWLDYWQTRRLYVVGSESKACADLKNIQIKKLPTEEDVLEECLESLDAGGPITSVVIANPSDERYENGGMSSLAPWIAGQHRAFLILTNDCGDDMEDRVSALLKDKRLRNLENVILVGDLSALPVKLRENPIAQGKDNVIEMEPFTPSGNDPYTFSVGRLFGDGPDGAAQLTLQLARQRLRSNRDTTSARPSALIASNPGDCLPLLETFSRTTTLELANAGYRTTTLFNKGLTRDALRSEMPKHDIVLWEGHHNTLIREWRMPEWDEPLPNSLIMLQSCLALQEAKAQPLIRRGAVAVVGTSTRTFSASGGAMSLAFFDAMLYDHESVGASLRQAKNFMLAYSILKQRKLGEEAKRTGANQRAAWSFTLWGDPTLTMLAPPEPENSHTPVQHEVRGSTIVLKVPETLLDHVQTAKYQVQMPANGRLAGLTKRDQDDDNVPLVPFLFTEVHLPQAPEGKRPVLKSKLPAAHYVFCWDARRRAGYLLVEPHSLDEHELHFHVSWED